MKRSWYISLFMGAACLSAALAGDWPQFRGPNNAGVSGETRLPSTWGAEKNIAWKIRLPGYGWSSPIVWGDKVFVTTAVSEKQQPPEEFVFPGSDAGKRSGGPAGARPGASASMALPLLTPAMGERLKLTDKQKEQVEKLQKEFTAKQLELFTKAGEVMQKAQNEKDPEAMTKAGESMRQAFGGLLKMRSDYLGKVRDLLDEGQKKSLAQLQKEEAAAAPGGFPGMPIPKPPEEVYRWEIYCLNAADGKILWKKIAAQHKPTIPTQASNTYASETPLTDGERVYAYFGMTGLYCYDFAGKLLWSKELGSYPMMMGWGTGSSPALDDERVFVQCDNEEKSFLAAFDKKTGKEIWRVSRNEKSSWGTPFLWRNKQRTELVAAGIKQLRSYDPASGQLLWELGKTGAAPSGTSSASATPVADEEMLYAGTGADFGSAPLFAVRAGASGDLTLPRGATSSDGVAWFRSRGGPAIASPLLYGGHLYILDQNGSFLSCYEAKSGKPVYRERLPGARGFTSSPWISDGKIFCLDQDGRTFVVQAGPEFKVLGKNEIGEMCWATPAAANGALFLRSRDHLYCIRQPAGKGE
jgi:outer membrane protein assembly factor BamB